jgi:diaminopimelate epimerase
LNLYIFNGTGKKMSEIEFTKMHGAGNDFIMIDDMDLSFEDDPRLIAALCETHRGIGADGLILIRPFAEFDFEMRYFNSDGSRAGMCGNGARCAARFALERGIAGQKMVFSTGSGPVSAEVAGDRVRIGLESVEGLRLGIDLLKGTSAGFAVSGVPHAAIFVEDAKGWERERFIETARNVRHDPLFGPEGTNVNLVTVVSPHSLVYRTYERGVEDETLACGTGAVGVSVIAAHMGLVSSPVSCETSGGDTLETAFDIAAEGAVNCFLTGPAVISFRGSAELPTCLSS